MNTNNNEEMIEELTDTDLSEPVSSNSIGDEIKPDKMINENNNDEVLGSPNKKSEENTVVLESGAKINGIEENKPEKEDNSPSNESEQEVVYETSDKSLAEEEKKSKAPLIVFLVILLIIDVAALVIYIIGIDKVLSFIK